MTEKQAERLKQKIVKIKAALAADRRRHGGFYDDSRGLRYLPPQYYIKLADYAGGRRYLNWFSKNFPGDIGYPDFLFEWTIILFKSGKKKEAEKKAFETFCGNTYLFDKFFGKPIVPMDKYEFSNLDAPSFLDSFNYDAEQAHLSDFSAWLNELISSDKFAKASQTYIDIHKRLKHEDDKATRIFLIGQSRQLEKEF